MTWRSEQTIRDTRSDGQRHILFLNNVPKVAPSSAGIVDLLDCYPTLSPDVQSKNKHHSRNCNRLKYRFSWLAVLVLVSSFAGEAGLGHEVQASWWGSFSESEILFAGLDQIASSSTADTRIMHVSI